MGIRTRFKGFEGLVSTNPTDICPKKLKQCDEKIEKKEEPLRDFTKFCAIRLRIRTKQWQHVKLFWKIYNGKYSFFVETWWGNISLPEIRAYCASSFQELETLFLLFTAFIIYTRGNTRQEATIVDAVVPKFLDDVLYLAVVFTLQDIGPASRGPSLCYLIGPICQLYNELVA